MATSALATAFVNIVPGTVELERYLKGELGNQAEAAGREAGKRTLKGMSQTLRTSGAQLAGVGKQMSMALTLPLAGVAAAGIKTAADFGVSMASLQVNTGASAKTMEGLRELAIKMGQDTVFSAGEAANAMLELSKGGMEPAAISGGALQSTMALAATEGMGLAEAATIITQSMNTFGLSAKDTGKAVDILAAGAVASTAGVRDLADGMKYVGSTAATLKVPLTDTVTALAALNNAGIDSTTAGTSLNSFMLRLIPTTRKAAEEAKSLGLNFVDATTGGLKPMNEVIKELVDTYGSMDDAARTASLKQIFGVEGMRAANILINEGVDGWNKLNGAVTKAGVAQDLANARMGGLAGVIEQFKGSVDTAFLKVGDRLTPAVTAFTTFFTALINGFASLPAPVQGAIVTIGAIVAAVGPLLIFVGNITKAVGILIPVISKLWIAMMANPIGLIVGAIAALVAGLVYFFTQTKTGQKVWADFTAFLSDAWKNVVNGWNNLVKWFGDLPNKIGQFFKNAGTWLLEAGKNILDGLLKGLQNAAGSVGKFFGDIANKWISDFKGFFGIKSPSKLFAEFGKNIMQGLEKGLNGSADQVTATMAQVSDFLVEQFNNKKLTSAAFNAGRALVLAYTGQLRTLANEQAKIVAELSVAQDKLTERLNEKIAFVQGLSNKYGAGSVISADSTVAEVTEKIEKQLADSKALADLGGKLLSMGLDQDLYKQIIENGAVSFAAEIVAGGQEAVTQLNVLASTANAEAQKLASQVGSILYDQGINFAQSVVDGLLAQKTTIESMMASIAASFAAEISALIAAANTAAEKKAVSRAVGTAKKVAAKVSPNLSKAVDKVASKTAPVAKAAAPKASAPKAVALSPNAGINAKLKALGMRALAAGGFVQSPTTALIGEKGPEVVTPLKDFERMMGLEGGRGPTVIYNAAPNQSIDAEQALITAIKRARIVA